MPSRETERCHIHRGPKSKPLQNQQESPSVRLDFFLVKITFQSRTTMLSLDIKYSMRDLICDIGYRARVAKLRCVT